LSYQEVLDQIVAIRSSLTALRQNRQLVKNENSRRILSGERASDVNEEDQPGFRNYQAFKEQYKRELEGALKELRKALDELEHEEPR
jgi:hypothetical protein